MQSRPRSKTTGASSVTKEEIQAFVNEDINPGLESHGGYLSIEKFDVASKSLYVQMGGGCQGCASSTATLKMMIETMLREQFPDLGEIVDATDHQSGEDPYYV